MDLSGLEAVIAGIGTIATGGGILMLKRLGGIKITIGAGGEKGNGKPAVQELHECPDPACKNTVQHTAMTVGKMDEKLDKVVAAVNFIRGRISKDDFSEGTLTGS